MQIKKEAPSAVEAAMEDVYKRQVQFRGRELMDLEIATVCLIFRFHKTKLYALRGEIVQQACLLYTSRCV